MTLEALRQEVGDHHFWKTIYSWSRSHAGGHGTTEQFIRLAEDVAGRQLDGLFETWLYTPEKPVVPAAESAGAATPSEINTSMRALDDLHRRLAMGGY